MQRDDAVLTIEECLRKISMLRGEKAFSPKHVEFVQSTGLELARVFGADSPIATNFTHVLYQPTGRYLTNVFTYQSDQTNWEMDAYQRGLDMAEGILRSASAQLTKHGIDKILSESRIKAEGARVFISHGKETGALNKVERYVRALGLLPIIVARGPSEGMSVDALVEKRLGESDCAIILATADDQVDDYFQPRPNVIHEIGLAQERLANRVVYLKEASCVFPSNVRPRVWENFTQDNMEAAFEKILKELRAFGVL